MKGGEKVQITVVNNMAVSRKDGGLFSENQAATGGFDMAMAAVLALLKPQPVESSQDYTSSGNSNSPFTGMGNVSFIDPSIFPGDLTENMIAMKPVVDQQEAQQTGVEGASGATGEMEQIPALTAIPDAAQEITATSIPEKFIPEELIFEKFIPEKSTNQLTYPACQAVQASLSSGMEKAPVDLPVLDLPVLMEDFQPEPGMKPDESQNGQAIISAQTVPVPAENNSQISPDIKYSVIQISDYAAGQSKTISQRPGDAVAPEIIVKDKPSIITPVVISEADSAKQINSISFVPAPEAIIAADSPVKNETMQIFQDMADVKNVSLRGSEVNAAEMKNVAVTERIFIPENTQVLVESYAAESTAVKESVPVNEKNPATGSTAAIEPQIANKKEVVTVVVESYTAESTAVTESVPVKEKNPATGSTAAREFQPTPEKEAVSVVSEKATMKPDVEEQSGVVKAKPQHYPELSYQGDNNGKQKNNRPGEAQATTGENNKSKITNSVVGTEKIEFSTGLGTSNATENSAQFPAQVSGESLKGVTLAGLKDRVLQEIRRVYNAREGEQQTRVQLKLEPEQLGQLTIKLYFHKGELNAHFYTENNNVKEVLEGSLQQLRDSLGRQDLKLNEAFVFVGDGSRDNSSFYYEGKNQSGTALYGRYDYRPDGDIPPEPPEARQIETSSWQVNYLV